MATDNSNVSLTFGGTTYKVYCQTVQVGWKTNTTAKPKVNGGSVVEVQTESFENPTYTLQGVQLVETSTSSYTSLTYPALLEMSKNRYDGTNGITLEVDFGRSASKLLVGSDGTTTDIPVVVTGFSFPLKVSDGRYHDGNDTFYLPTLTILLQETA